MAKIFSIVFFLAFLMNCGTALTYQEEQQAAQKQNNSGSNSILAALGLSVAGGASSSFMGISPTSLSIQVNNKSTYNLTFPTWPLSSDGFINIDITHPGTLITNISPTSVNIFKEVTYTPTAVPIDINVGAKPGTESIIHTVTDASDPSIIGQVLGTVNVTVTP